MTGVPASLSPFCPAMLWEAQNRALLLQFLFYELLNVHRILSRKGPFEEILSPPKGYFPYDWAGFYGPLNRAQDCTYFFTQVFPELQDAAQQLQKTFNKLIFSQAAQPSRPALKKKLQHICLLLEPFIEICKENENLIYFLLKHREEIDSLMRKNYLKLQLLRLHPNGPLELCEKMCDNYHHRGFVSSIAEMKQLIAQIL